MAIIFQSQPKKDPNHTSLADSALKAYEENPASSLWNIIQAYLKGRFAGEEEKILPIIEASAERGKVYAQSALGEILLFGLGRQKDTDRAISLLEKAAEKREGRAQYHLGSLLEKENPEKALRLYIDAFHSGVQETEPILGRYCEMGICMPKDPYLSAYWYKRAFKNGNEKAKMDYDRIIALIGEENWEKYMNALFRNGAFPTTLMLAEAGDPDEQYELGKIYMDGLWTKKNPEMALKWFEKSAAQGNINAKSQIDLLKEENI